jgi:glycosyltransferase involved in cell wall biosynthesis
MSAGPEVSICIPAYEAEAWIERAVRSALEQTHRDLEVVVVDNASADGTVARVLGIADARVRLYANSHNLGVYRNFNRAVALARGRYIKFLCADDVLEPSCVEEMLRPFALSQRVGLCFTPRAIVLEDPADESGGRWKAKHERTHERFGELHEVNGGSALLEPWLADRLADNWIGEPSNVMMSRECLARVGTFPLRMHDKGDMDLWIRAMLDHEVGFVDRPLARLSVRNESLGVANRETGRPWLDTVWMLEGILSFDEAQRHPKLRGLRRRALARAARNALLGRRVPDRGKLAAARAYAAFRLPGRGHRSRLYGAIDDRVPAGETVAVSAAGPPVSGGASGLVSAGRSRSGSGSGP